MKKKMIDGFGLLEAALALLIMGLAGSMGLMAFKAKRDLTALEITRQHQELIARAVASYILEYQRLPLPACSPMGESLPPQDPQSLTFSEGCVPFKTLGIPPHGAKDGWGNYITYAVNTTLCQPQDGPFLEKFCQYVPPLLKKEDNSFGKSLQITFLTEEGGRSLEESTEVSKNPFILVLISHGPQGGGSYKKPGSKERNSLKGCSEWEKLNISSSLSEGKGEYVYAPYRSQGLPLFRQVVLPFSRETLLSSYGHFSCKAHLYRLQVQQEASAQKQERKREARPPIPSRPTPNSPRTQSSTYSPLLKTPTYPGLLEGHQPSSPLLLPSPDSFPSEPLMLDYPPSYQEENEEEWEFFIDESHLEKHQGRIEGGSAPLLLEN